MYNMWQDEKAAAIQEGSPDALLSRAQMWNKYPKPLVAIDRDGVLIKCKDVVKSVESFEPIEGSLSAISMIRSKGYKIAIIFDQPGISRGELTVEDVDRMNDHMIDLFGQAGCPSIDGTLYNMSDIKDDIYSKPNTGMLKRLRDEMGVPLKGGYYVGDRLVDAKMADKAKLKPVLVKTGKYSEDEKKFNSYANRPLKKKTKIFNDLLEFAQALQ
jgi:D-glycero-D-manno-heptose 1,7-bisphosphate phosphatase